MANLNQNQQLTLAIAALGMAPADKSMWENLAPTPIQLNATLTAAAHGAGTTFALADGATDPRLSSAQPGQRWRGVVSGVDIVAQGLTSADLELLALSMELLVQGNGGTLRVPFLAAMRVLGRFLDASAAPADVATGCPGGGPPRYPLAQRYWCDVPTTYNLRLLDAVTLAAPCNIAVLLHGVWGGNNYSDAGLPGQVPGLSVATSACSPDSASVMATASRMRMTTGAQLQGLLQSGK